MVGQTEAAYFLAVIRARRWGRVWSRGRPKRCYPEEPWALDNGAYGCWRRGVPFDGDRFLRRVARADEDIGSPYFAVLPDLFQNGRESLPFSLSWIERLPSSWPWFLAVQDGMGDLEVERALERCAGLFLGGSDENHARAALFADIAHRNGKRLHIGRCSQRRWIELAQDVGADSIDSSQPLWSLYELGRFCRILDQARLAWKPN